MKTACVLEFYFTQIYLRPDASIISILVSRFIMNLRGVYTPGGSAPGSLHLSKLSDVRFANSVVGNLGAPLGFEEEEEKGLASRPEDEDVELAKISDNPLMEYLPLSSPDDTIGATPEEAVS